MEAIDRRLRRLEESFTPQENEEVVHLVALIRERRRWLRGRWERRRRCRLPTFEVGAEVFLKRVTLILWQGRVEKVFYPVYPPEKSAEEVLRWLAPR